MQQRRLRPFGAIRWDESGDLDNSIHAARSFAHLDEAVAFVAPEASDGQRWAVVDLRTMRVVAGTQPTST